jgi:hypothetical protein
VPDTPGNIRTSQTAAAFFFTLFSRQGAVPKAMINRSTGFAAELRGCSDHLLVVGRSAQVLDIGQVPQSLDGQAEDGQGLGSALGDLVGCALDVQGVAGAGKFLRNYWSG